MNDAWCMNGRVVARGFQQKLSSYIKSEIESDRRNVVGAIHNNWA